MAMIIGAVVASLLFFLYASRASGDGRMRGANVQIDSHTEELRRAVAERFTDDAIDALHAKPIGAESGSTSVHQLIRSFYANYMLGVAVGRVSAMSIPAEKHAGEKNTLIAQFVNGIREGLFDRSLSRLLQEMEAADEILDPVELGRRVGSASCSAAGSSMRI